MSRRRIVILGAAGRDFHNFNVVYRERPEVEVVAFTATQIPKIEGRRYPASLSGPHYPDGIPIVPQAELEKLIADQKVEECVLSYSDISYETVGGLSARVNAAGANFTMPGTKDTMLSAKVKVIAVTAIRTGCGKSQTSRHVAEVLRDAGHRVVVVRHPMPYGNLEKQAVQRFTSREDMDKHECTFEEREEYEQHIDHGTTVYAGVDYGAILEQASKECDVLLWDGGNNDWPFYKPDLWVTVADPLRAGHETRYYPGEVNFRSADIIVINKADYATKEQIEAVQRSAKRLSPRATVLRARSEVTVEDPKAVAGKRVLCIEDGPTLTHGEMTLGAAQVAAERFGASEVVDPRPNAVGSIKKTLEKYPHIGALLPAMGYFPDQIADLEESIRRTDCDLVLVGTPFDLVTQLHIDKPAMRVRYSLKPFPEDPSLDDQVRQAAKA